MAGFEVIIDFAKLPDENLSGAKRAVLHRRGLSDRYPITGAIGAEILDAVRVLHMTELELYFLKMEAPLEPTPRTQMNSLVYLFKYFRDNREKLLFEAQSIQNGVLLLENTVQSLYTLCDAFMSLQTPKTPLKRWLLRDSDPAAVAFHSWIQREQVECRVEIADFEATGRGLAAAVPIERNEVVLRLPWKMIFSVHKALESPHIGHILKSLDLDEDSILLLFTLFECFVNGPNSYWKPYWDALPQTVDSALYFSAVELDMFLNNNPLQVEIINMREHLLATYERLVPPLCAQYPDIFPEAAFSWENYVWARSMFDSRGFHLDIQGKTYNCLLPLVDFLNNHNITLLEGSGILQEPARDYVIRTLVPLGPGQQVFMNYGSFSHRELLLFYGYESNGGQCNPYDVYPLELEVPDDDGLGNLRAAVLSRVGLSTEHYLKFNKGVPRRLLATMRAFLMAPQDLQALSSNQYSDAAVEDRLFNNVERDIEAISLVQSLVTALKESLEEANPWAADDNVPKPEEYQNSERARLAVTYCRVQLLILRDAEQACERLLSGSQ